MGCLDPEGKVFGFCVDGGGGYTAGPRDPQPNWGKTSLANRPHAVYGAILGLYRDNAKNGNYYLGLRVYAYKGSGFRNAESIEMETRVMPGCDEGFPPLLITQHPFPNKTPFHRTQAFLVLIA